MRTFRAQLIYGYAIVLLLSMLIISGVFYLHMNKILLDISRQYINAQLEAAVDVFNIESLSGEAFIKYLSEMSAISRGAQKIHYAIFDKDGLLLAGAQDFNEVQGPVDQFVSGMIPADNKIEKIVKNNTGGKLLTVTSGISGSRGEEYFLQFGIGLRTGKNTMSIIAETFIVVVPVVLVITIIGGFILTGKMLAPVKRLTESARNISFYDIKGNLPVSGTGDELDELASTFNKVFDRLRESYGKILAFTADASHELRLPITAIKGQAEVVLERERDINEYRETLGSIIEEMDSLTSMVNKLLLLTRGDSNEFKSEKRDTDIAALLKKLTEFYSVLAEDKKIGLSFISAADAIMIKCDASRIRMLFSNLIENAIKYTMPGGEVKVILEKKDNSIDVMVEDSGIGIDKDDQEKIFERFYRVDKARSRKEGGFGLGLSIARLIVHEHGGDISVTSALHRGSVFKVSLPAKNI